MGDLGGKKKADRPCDRLLAVSSPCRLHAKRGPFAAGRVFPAFFLFFLPSCAWFTPHVGYLPLT